MTFGAINGMLPEYIKQLFHTCENSDYVLRSSNLKLSQPKPKTNFLKNSFSYRGGAYWNNIPKKLVENPIPISIGNHAMASTIRD